MNRPRDVNGFLQPASTGDRICELCTLPHSDDGKLCRDCIDDGAGVCKDCKTVYFPKDEILCDCYREAREFERGNFPQTAEDIRDWYEEHYRPGAEQ